MNVAVIPARGNSKEIPRKNMKELAGQPLIYWTLSDALQSDIDVIIVSSEDKEILNYCEGVGMACPTLSRDRLFLHQRDGRLSQDHVQLSEVVLDAIRWYEFYYTTGEALINLVVTLQPTSPFRGHYILNSILRFAESFAKWDENDGVISVDSGNGFPYAEVELDNVISTSAIGHDPLERAGRQWGDSKEFHVYKENGSVYITEYEHLTKRLCVRPRSGHVSLYSFDMWEQNIDINTEDDWALAEFAATRFFSNEN
jgi:CMP-N,N'-diacetyllegionaminic acid synthase